MNRSGAILALAGAFLVSAAHAAPVTFVASAGPVAVAGEASGQFAHGRSFQVDAEPHAASANAWLLRFAYVELGAHGESPLQFYSGTNLYSPVTPTGTALRQTSLEAGLAREFGASSIRPRIEALVGVGWTEQPNPAAALQNDRRPDPGSSLPSLSGHATPTLSLGAGLEFPAIDRLGLRISAAARWLPAERFNGVLLPIRAGAVWPTEPAVASPATGSRRGPVLRVSSGFSYLRNPTRVRSEMTPSVAFAAALEQPLRSGLALSLQGEHVAERDAVPTYRQETDDFGNPVFVLVGRSPLSVTLTTATLGLRASYALGSITGSVRAGAGWGRTGGFGGSESRTLGLYGDSNGYLHPLVKEFDYGAGVTETGLAYSGSVGLEARIVRSLAVFAEAGTLGLHLSRDDVLVVPLRMGAILR